MSVSAFIRRCIDAGMPIEMALMAGEQLEAGSPPAAAPVQAAREVISQAPSGDELRYDAMRAAGLTLAEWNARRFEIIERDGGICQYCRAPATPPHVDHIIPVSRGGSFDHSNLCVACPPCNKSKGAKLVAEWRR